MNTNTNTDKTTAAAATTLTLEQRLLAILNSDAVKKRNTPAYLLATYASALIEEEDDVDNLPDAARWLAARGDYGTYGGQLGGVNVTRDAAGELEVEWTTGDDSTWCNVDGLVAAAEDGGDMPDWYGAEWIQMDNTEDAGYLAVGADGLIWGHGVTLAECEAEARRWCGVENGADSVEDENEAIASMEFCGATAAALHLVRTAGADAARSLCQVCGVYAERAD